MNHRHALLALALATLAVAGCKREAAAPTAPAADAAPAEETKNAVIAEGSKANHLSYLGDTLIGSKVNIGAGTITCNYDGVNKSTTTIGDGAFVGSNSSLVAPVTIGAEATVGAGSVITTDAPEGKLTVARGQQRTIDGWRRPQKKR